MKKIIEKIKQIRKTKAGRIVFPIITSIIMLCIAGGIGVIVAIGRYNGGVEKYAEQYFECIRYQNWYTLYDNTEFDKTSIDRTDFAIYMNLSNTVPEGVSDYTLDISDEKDGIVEVQVTYTTGEEQKSTSFIMKKQSKRVGIFFATWKGYMNGDDIAQVVAQYNENLMLDELLTQDDYADMQNVSQAIVTAFYNGVMEGTDGAEIKELFKENENTYTHIDELMTNMLHKANMDDGHSIVSISISSFEVGLQERIDEYNAAISVTYNCSYSAKGSTEEYLETGQLYRGMVTDTAIVYFSYEDGSWYATDVDIDCIDYIDN